MLIHIWCIKIFFGLIVFSGFDCAKRIRNLDSPGQNTYETKKSFIGMAIYYNKLKLMNIIQKIKSYINILRFLIDG